MGHGEVHSQKKRRGEKESCEFGKF